MLIMVTIIMLVGLVKYLEKLLLQNPLQDRAHNRYYPFPSYSRQRYYRKIMFADKEPITVYNNFKEVEKIEEWEPLAENGCPFLKVVQSIAAKKTTLRIVECMKIPGVLVYTDNTQSPTHVFCIDRCVSEIIDTGKCNIKDELGKISENIKSKTKWSLNQIGLVLLMINLEYLPYVVWGKHGDYIVGWDKVDPVILIRIGDEVKDKLEEFRANNPKLCSMVEGEWDKRLFLCTIDNSSMHIMVKHNTPKNIFPVRFREKLNRLGSKSYIVLNREEKEIVNRVKEELYKNKMLCTEIENRECFGKELKQFLQNLKEFVSDGTCFELPLSGD